MSSVPVRVSTLVSPAWLAQKLMEGAPGLQVLDASWHMPFTKRSGLQEFYKQHIPTAQFFAIDDCCDKTSPYDHMVPGEKQFEEYVGNLGISNNTHVIVYDNNPNFGMFSAPRVWWMFKYFGHHSVSVVEGGLPSWLDEGYESTDQVDYVAPQVFKAATNHSMLKLYEDVERNLTDNAFTLIDARPSGRFEGTAPEPRPGIKPGHIPGAINLPFASVLDQKARKLKDLNVIRDLFEKASIDFSRPLVTMCGSGVCACIVVLAAHEAQLADIALYDGAWLEWFQRAHPRNKECCNV